MTAQAGDYTAAQVGAVDGATGQGSAVRISNRNLLDNGDFRNPVNQRGQTSYTGNRYGLTGGGSAPTTALLQFL